MLSSQTPGQVCLFGAGVTAAVAQYTPGVADPNSPTASCPQSPAEVSWPHEAIVLVGLGQHPTTSAPLGRGSTACRLSNHRFPRLLAEREDGLPGGRRREPASQEIGDPLSARGQPQLNPLMQTHFPTTWVTPGPSGQRDFNLGLATLGIDESHLGFAVLLSALVAIAHPVPGDDSNAARVSRR